MYKIAHPYDRSRLFYPDRKALETISVTEIGTMPPCNGYSKDISNKNYSFGNRGYPRLPKLILQMYYVRLRDYLRFLLTTTAPADITATIAIPPTATEEPHPPSSSSA